MQKKSKIIKDIEHYETQGETIYKFNKKTGVLEASINPDDLEKMAMIGTECHNPNKMAITKKECYDYGWKIKLPHPYSLGEIIFKGVKEIKSIKTTKGNYFFSIEIPDLEYELKKYLAGGIFH
jgi:hypothetical protein